MQKRELMRMDLTELEIRAVIELDPSKLAALEAEIARRKRKSRR